MTALFKKTTISPVFIVSKREDQKESPAAIGDPLVPQELSEQSRAITARIIKLSPREGSRARHRTREVEEWKKRAGGGKLDRVLRVGDFAISRGGGGEEWESKMCSASRIRYVTTYDGGARCPRQWHSIWGNEGRRREEELGT